MTIQRRKLVLETLKRAGIAINDDASDSELMKLLAKWLSNPDNG